MNIDTNVIYEYIIYYKLDINTKKLFLSLKVIDIKILLR